MPSKTQNKHSVCAVRNPKTKRNVMYLSQRDIDNGLDIQLDLLGYEVVVL